jgi:DNA repair and recombination RAD54-like protein
VFKVKDKDQLFRRRFAVPLINKDAGNYNPFRPAPTLGMRTGAIFIPKPLHDPSGEFAIVLYDPTTDDKPEPGKGGDCPGGEEEKPVLDTPIMHKSLADILGLKKKVVDHPKIPVVIDPRLAKVLRPHQVEGVKVYSMRHSQANVETVVLTCQVSLSMYYGTDRRKSKRLHHGR